MVGGHLITAFSRTQAVVALSSAEAELYALTMASSETLGVKALAADFGVTLGAWMWVDASAAIGIARRKGLGKVRHVETQALWVQDAIARKELGLEKIHGRDNPSDLQTRYLDANSIERHLRRIGAEVRDGRPEVAPGHVPGEAVVMNEFKDVDGVAYAKDCEGVKKAGGRSRKESYRTERLRSARAWWRESLREMDLLVAHVDSVGLEEVSSNRLEATFEESWCEYVNAATCVDDNAKLRGDGLPDAWS